MQLEPMIKRNLSDEVRDRLLEYVRQEGMKQNAKLPPEAELARLLGVSRVTLRRSLSALEQSGLLLRIHGKGTFVNQEALQIRLNLSEGLELKNQILKSGYSARVEVVRVDRIVADQTLAQYLQIQEGEPVIEIEKLFYANDHPATVCIDRFAENILTVPLPEEEKDQTIFDLLRRISGRIIVRDKIEISTMSKEEMQKESRSWDKMECQSLLVFHSVNYDQNNSPVIYDTEMYDTRYIKFHLMRNKMIHYDENVTK